MTCNRKYLRCRLVPFPLLSLVLLACHSIGTTPITHDIVLGDLDGDGDLDAFFANGESDHFQPNSVWINQGGGVFQDSGQSLGNADTYSAALGDLDGDGDLDAVEGGWGLIYLNDGLGNFSRAGQAISQVEGSYTRYAALGDLDQDGDMDMTLAGCCGAFSGDENEQWVILPASTVLLNDSGGHFKEAQLLTHQACPAAALGDLDSDGDLDTFLACWVVIDHSGIQADTGGLFDNSVQAFLGPYNERDRAPNRVYFNDGTGIMLDSGQDLGNAASFAVALGDLDGDDDLDAFVGNLADAEIWINQGGAQYGLPGQFAVGDQRISRRNIKKIVLGDVDDDGDLDALLNIYYRGFTPELWLNDGRAGFTRHKQSLEVPDMQVYTLGDIDGDRDLDIFAGSFDRGYAIWINNGLRNYELQRYPD